MRIAIIGAGPAGAMAAFTLARAGASVSLFDASHPREKPCGGGLTGRALGLVSDIIDIAALPCVTIASALVESAHRDARARSESRAHVPLVDRGVSPASSLVVVSREMFDRALADAAVGAGATLVRERAVDVTRQAARFSIRTTHARYEADYVLGADGANSLVRKRLAHPFARTQLSIAAGFFVHGPTSRTIAVRNMREQPGYLWLFPRPDHLAVGVCAAATDGASSPQLREQSHTWIQHHRLDHDARLVPYAWPIPSIGSAGSRADVFGGRGWMLLGDAAGLVDPLTREGIYFALLSGRWASEALTTGSPERAATAYASRIRAELQPELALAARFSRLFFSPAFSGLMVKALAESPSIRQVFADLVGGVQPYRTLRRRLLATRHWTLAIRMLAPVFADKMRPALLSATHSLNGRRSASKELHMGRIGMAELVIILFIVVLIFGANRLPQLATGIGKSIRNFKDGIKEGEDTKNT